MAGHLVLIGHDFADTMEIRPAGLGLNVTMNNVAQGLFRASVRQVIAYGLGGNDQIRDMLSHPVRFYGGAGDDNLFGGRSHDILLGELGNDMLAGGIGRDILIGGLGSDNLDGNGAILINGTTAYDGDPAGAGADHRGMARSKEVLRGPRGGNRRPV